MVGCQLGDGIAARRDTHYRGSGESDGSQKHAAIPTPLRLLQLARLAKDQGLSTNDAQENAETARPSVASRACFRRIAANCCAVRG